MKKGFTLVELLFVLAILFMVSTLSFPAFSSFKNQLLLQETAQAIASELRRLQSQAVSQHETLSFNPQGFDLPAYFKFQSSKTIIFSSSGFPTPGGSGSIILENKVGQLKKIIVSSLGRVRIE